MIRARRALLVLLLGYVLLDLCSPFVPGAFTWDPQLSVDGLGGARVRRDVPSRSEAAVLPVVRVAPVPLSPARFALPTRVQLAWSPHLARDHAAHTADPRPSPDDH